MGTENSINELNEQRIDNEHFNLQNTEHAARRAEKCKY